MEILGRGDVDNSEDETAPGMMVEDAAIAWQPRGALIAVSGIIINEEGKNRHHRHHNCPCVVFYEKNGLRRSSLIMRGHTGKITNLSWSVDSLTLAISTFDETTNESFVSIWTRGNAHWTCKRSLETSTSSNSGSSSESSNRASSSSSSSIAMFDTKDPNTLRIVKACSISRTVKVETHAFVWDDCTASDLGTAAVIDGDILKITPFSRSVVPPPMCDHSLRFPTKISEAVWRPNALFSKKNVQGDEKMEEACFVLLQDGRYKIVHVDENADSEELYEERDEGKHIEECQQDVSMQERREMLRSFCWIGEKYIAAVYNESTIVRIELDKNADYAIKYIDWAWITLPKQRICTKLVHCSSSGYGDAVGESNMDGFIVAFIAGEKMPLSFPMIHSDSSQQSSAKNHHQHLHHHNNNIEHLIGTVCLQKAKALANGQVVALYSNGDLNLFHLGKYTNENDKKLLLMKNVDSFEAFFEDDNKTWVKSLPRRSDRRSYYERVSLLNAIACVSRDSKLRVIRLSSIVNDAVVEQLSKSFEAHEFFNVDPAASRRNWKDVSGDGKTRLGELAFDSLHGKMRAAMRPDDANTTNSQNSEGFAKRTVERGSRIVSIPPGSCNVVLQQPRGNLEIIAPKALVLPSIVKSLRRRDYKTAFQLCAKERVDLNIMVDYDFPSSIEPSADELVRGLETPEKVMELLEALRVGDAFTEDGGFMRKLCASAVTECPDKSKFLEDIGVQKVRRTCAAIRASISSLYMTPGTFFCGNSRWSLAMLTSYACGTGSFLETSDSSQLLKFVRRNKHGLSADVDDANDIPSIAAAKRKDLAEALERVAEVREFEIKDASRDKQQQSALNGNSTSSATIASSLELVAINSDSSDADETEFIGAKFSEQKVSAARMLKHLLFLTNDRELFEAALSTGNLSIAHLVGMNSQAMDPGEFVPELQALYEMREFERSATISERLEMWRDAAKFWLRDKSYAKAANVASKHGLFPYLHNLCEGNDQGEKFDAESAIVVTKYHAEYLENVVNRAEDAGIAYIKCHEYASALRCFTSKSASGWRSGFIVAKEKLKFSNDNMLKLASETCKNLESISNDYVSAARISLEFLDDVERAVANFALAKKWRDAKLTCFAKNRSDLFETTVFPECVVGAAQLLEHFTDVQSRADKYKERLIGLQDRRKLYKKTFASIEEGRMRPRRAGGSDDDEYDDGLDAISEMNSEFSNVSGYSLYATSTQLDGGSSIASGSQQSSSRWSASTVGGRKNKKGKKKSKKNKNGLRAGGPTEERDLSSHVITEVRVGEDKLEECAEICEVLIASDNSDDAKVLQNAASVAIEKCRLMRVSARESLHELVEDKEKEEESILLLSASSPYADNLPPEVLERKREIEIELKSMRESMSANAKDDSEIVSFKWSSIRSLLK